MKKPKYLVIIVCSFVLLAWVLTSVILFFKSSLQIETDRVNTNFFNITQNNIHTLNVIFSEYATTMIIAAHAIVENPKYSDDELLLAFLQEINTAGRFLCVSFHSPGRSFASSGLEYHEYQGEMGYERFSETEVSISDAYYDPTYGESIVALRIPLKESNTESYLVAKVSILALSRLLDNSFITNGGYYHIIDENGSYIATSDSGNEVAMEFSFYEAMSLLEYMPGYSEGQFLQNVANKSLGVIEYSYEGNSRNMYYMFTGINDWILTTIIPKDVIRSFAQSHQIATFYLVLSILVAMGFIIVWVAYSEKKNQAKVQLMYDSIKSLAEKAQKIIVEWDYKTHTLTSLSEYKSVFGRDLILTDIRKNILNSDIFHKDDASLVTEMLKHVKRGESITNERIRIRHKDGTYIWCLFDSTVVKSTKGELLKAFAFIENIDSEVRHTEKLKNSAQRDALTGLFNKAQTEELIIRELEDLGSKLGALCIIDFDNFKLINDTFGHQKGDEVLKEVSAGLRTIFRSDDIIGRIGGDEFFAYIKHIDTIDDVKKKAKTVCETLKKTYTENESSVDITFSIGIALAPKHGITFTELYSFADKALYKVKNSGKNNYLIYSGKE